MEEFLKGKRVLYAVPVSDQLESFWREVVKSLAAPVQAGLFYKNESEHVIEKPTTEQRIRAKTAWNSDTLRGDYADLLILDEYQLMHESAWGEVGAPMLLDNNGDAIFIYTPPSLHSQKTAVSKADDPQHAAKMFKKAQKDKTGRWAAFHWTSHDNPHISKEAVEEIAEDMTQLAYRQEIMAEDIEEIPGALWTHKLIEECRTDEDEEAVLKRLVRVVVGVDPTGSTTNECGIVGAGVDREGNGYVVRDRSLLGKPEEWGSAAVWLLEDLRGDRIVAEKNFGGDMVESTLRAVDASVPVTMVSASRGKTVRAEPVCALYQRGKVKHVGKFAELEEEMCLAAGTLVETSKGNVPIELIRAQDLVMTRQGWKPVLWAGRTGRAITLTVHVDSWNIRCTPSHLLGIIAGWAEAKSLELGDEIVCRSNQFGRSLSSMARGISSRTMGTSRPRVRVEAKSTIGSCIESIMVASQTATLFTTWTRIAATMRWITCWPFLAASTPSFMIQAPIWPSLQPREAESGGRNGNVGSHTMRRAQSAKGFLRLEETARSTVAGPVEMRAITAVTQNGTAEDVYNLSVDGCPEFFANGFLVHNCSYVPGNKSPNRMDALVWALTDLMLGERRLRAGEAAPGAVGKPISAGVMNAVL